MVRPEVLHSSATHEWYTPKKYIDAARSVLGAIDLDPASSAIANQTIEAANFYSLSDNGLSQPWHGRVWLNPPYGKINNQSNQALWSQRLIVEYRAGNVQQAILLVNAQTSEKWFQPLWQFPICFSDHRIRFESPTGKGKSPTHGNAFIYLGSSVERFQAVFSQFGEVC